MRRKPDRTALMASNCFPLYSECPKYCLKSFNRSSSSSFSWPITLFIGKSGFFIGSCTKAKIHNVFRTVRCQRRCKITSKCQNIWFFMPFIHVQNRKKKLNHKKPKFVHNRQKDNADN